MEQITYDVRVEMTPSQQSKFNNYFSSVQTSQMNAHGEYIIASVRRLGLSAFRIILILSWPASGNNVIPGFVSKIWANVVDGFLIC